MGSLNVLRGIERASEKRDLWRAGCDLNPKWTKARPDEQSLQLSFAGHDERLGNVGEYCQHKCPRHHACR